MRPPRRLRGPDSLRVPFLQTLRTSRGVLGPAAWFLRGESSVWSLILALENVSSRLPQHSRCYPAHLVANKLRALVSQPGAKATDCSTAASTGLKTGALSDRAVPLCFLAKKQCQGDEALAQSHSLLAAGPGHQPTAPHPARSRVAHGKKMTQG